MHLNFLPFHIKVFLLDRENEHQKEVSSSSFSPTCYNIESLTSSGISFISILLIKNMKRIICGLFCYSYRFMSHFLFISF